MANLKKITQRDRKNGKEISHYRVRWQEPWLDENGVPVRNEKGKIKQRSQQETFPSEAEAKARKAVIEGAKSRAARIVSRADGNQLFSECAVAWFEDMKLDAADGKIKLPTVEAYWRDLARYALPRFGARGVASISSTDAREFRLYLEKLGQARSTRKHNYDVFRWVLDFAVDEKIIPENPAKITNRNRRKEKPVVAVPRGRVLSENQVAELASVVARSYPVYGLMVLFVAYTGVRAAELAGLNVEDVELWERKSGGYSGKVHVHRTRYRTRKSGPVEGKYRREWAEGTPKSRNSTRAVPMQRWLAERMHTYLTETHPNATPGTPLFPNRKDGGARAKRSNGKVVPTDLSVNLDWAAPIAPGTFYANLLKPALREIGVQVSDRKAGIKGFRFHDLRHTFATTLLDNGYDYRDVSRWLGHVNYVITLTIYAHWIRNDDDKMMDRIAEPSAIAGTPTPPAAPASNVVPFRPRRNAG